MVHGSSGTEAMPADAAPPAHRDDLLRPRRWGATFASLAERDFAWFFVGTLAFFTASQMQLVLRGYLAFELTDAASALGFISASVALPMLVAAPLGGVLADRVNKTHLLMVTQTLSAAISLVVALLVLSGVIAFWQLLIAAVVHGLVMSLNMPARQAMVPQLVPRHKLMNAISLQMGGQNLTRIVAPALAGLLIGPIGQGWVWILTTVLFLLAVASEFMLPKHGLAGTRSPRRFQEDLVGGFRYVKSEPTMRLLILAGLLMPLFGFPVMQLLPVFAREIFDKGPSGLGVLSASAGAGGLIGALVAANLDGQPAKGRVMLLGGLVMGGFLLAFASIGTYYLAALFLLLGANIGQMVFNTINNSVIQAMVPEEYRGRVMSLLMMSFGLMPLGVIPVSAASDAIGADLAVAGMAVVLLVVLVALFASSQRLRTLRLESFQRAVFSPVQAARLVADGKLTPEEASRLLAADWGAATPPLPTAHAAPPPVIPTRITQPALSHGPLARAPALSPREAVLPRAAAGDQPTAAPPRWRRATRVMRAARGPRRAGVLGSAFAVGLLVGFASSGSGELLRAARARLADWLDPDS